MSGTLEEIWKNDKVGVVGLFGMAVFFVTGTLGLGSQLVNDESGEPTLQIPPECSETVANPNKIITDKEAILSVAPEPY